MSDLPISDRSDSDLTAVFKAYDIRGLVPEQLDARDCAAIGAAFARFVESDDGSGTVVIGRDMRPSGIELVAAFTEGVLGQGLDVIDIGLASTDMLYFASGELDAPGAMFTASHNPAGYNGIKLCRRSAGPIGQESGLMAIRDLAADPPAPGGRRGERREDELLGSKIDFLNRG